MAPGRADHDLAAELRAFGRDHLRRVAERDPLLAVIGGQLFQSAVNVDGPLVTCGPQQSHQALRLAERISAEDVGPLGEQLQRGQQLADFIRRIRVPEDRQAECRLRDEGVAADRLEGHTGRVPRTFVVAGKNERETTRFDLDLCRAQNMTRGVKLHPDVADRRPTAERRRLALTREIVSVAHRHDVERMGGRHDGAVAGTGVIGMSVRDQGPRYWPHRVNIEIATRAIKPKRR